MCAVLCRMIYNSPLVARRITVVVSSPVCFISTAAYELPRIYLCCSCTCHYPVMHSHESLSRHLVVTSLGKSIKAQELTRGLNQYPLPAGWSQEDHRTSSWIGHYHSRRSTRPAHREAYHRRRRGSQTSIRVQSHRMEECFEPPV